MSFIPQVAAAFLPGAINAVGQAAGTAMGNAAGRIAGAGLNSDSVFDTLNKAGIQLDPDQQARLQNHYAREAGQDTLNQQMQGTAFTAGLGNTVQNLQTQRQMALNAQQNAANNVANQLQTLRDRSAQNAQAISAAMQTGAALYR